VRSVESQTYKDFETIVVDDCSPAPSASQILSNCSLRRCTIVRHDENQGMAAARNSAISRSTGDLILPLDCDDFIDRSYLSTAVAVLSEKELGGVYTQVQVFGDRELVWIPEMTMLNVMSGLPGPSTFLYKREVYESIGGYDTGIYHTDSNFWLCALKQGWQFERIESPLYHYRKHAQGMSNFNKREEVLSLARHHPELYIENMHEILRIQEEKYWQVKAEYQKLEEHFHTAMTTAMGNYRELEGKYHQLAALYLELHRHPHLYKVLQTLWKARRSLSSLFGDTQESRK